MSGEQTLPEAVQAAVGRLLDTSYGWSERYRHRDECLVAVLVYGQQRYNEGVATLTAERDALLADATSFRVLMAALAARGTRP